MRADGRVNGENGKNGRGGLERVMDEHGMRVKWKHLDDSTMSVVAYETEG